MMWAVDDIKDRNDEIICTGGFTALCSFKPYLCTGMDFPHISTSGYGEVTAVPDMAEFSVKVVESTMNAEQAKAAVDKAVTESPQNW